MIGPLCSKRSRTSVTAGDARPSRRWGARSAVRGRASSMSIRTSITTEASSRSWASPSRSPTPSSRGARGGRGDRHARPRRRRTRASARSMSCRSSTCATRTASSPRTRRSRSRTGSPPSSSCPCSCTACWRPSRSAASGPYFREGGIGALAGAARGRRAGAGLRAAPAPSDRRRDARRRRPPLVAFNVELDRAGSRRGEGDRGRASRGRRRPRRRARDRGDARPCGDGAGLDQRAGPVRGAARGDGAGGPQRGRRRTA